MALIEYAEQCRKGGIGTHALKAWQPKGSEATCDFCERRIVLLEKQDSNGGWVYMDWMLVTEWP